jgi:hypothetical protein
MDENVYELRVSKIQLDLIKKALDKMPSPLCDTEEYDEYIQLHYDLDTTEPI